MNKKMFFTWTLALTLLCCTACGRRMNSATDGSDKTDQNTLDTTVEDNNGNGTLTNGTDNNDYNTIDNFDNGTTNDNVVDGVVNGVEDTVDGVIDGVDDVIDGTENTLDDTTNTAR